MFAPAAKLADGVFFFFFFFWSQTNEAKPLPPPPAIRNILCLEMKCDFLRWPLTQGSFHPSHNQLTVLEFPLTTPFWARPFHFDIANRLRCPAKTGTSLREPLQHAAFSADGQKLSEHVKVCQALSVSRRDKYWEKKTFRDCRSSSLSLHFSTSLVIIFCFHFLLKAFVDSLIVSTFWVLSMQTLHWCLVTVNVANFRKFCKQRKEFVSTKGFFICMLVDGRPKFRKLENFIYEPRKFLINNNYLLNLWKFVVLQCSLCFHRGVFRTGSCAASSACWRWWSSFQRWYDTLSLQ